MSEADHEDSVLLRQDGLVDLPAIMEMWEHVRHLDPKLSFPKLKTNTYDFSYTLTLNGKDSNVWTTSNKLRISDRSVSRDALLACADDGELASLN